MGEMDIGGLSGIMNKYGWVGPLQIKKAHSHRRNAFYLILF
jgi:hypothetical protein